MNIEVKDSKDSHEELFREHVHELCLDEVNTASLCRTFVSSLRSGGSALRGRVVRVAQTRIHILIVVWPRLRRPETNGDRETFPLSD